MVHSTDHNIGRIIKFLKKNNLYDNTLIVFTSDNGGLSTQRKVAPTSVFPLRAGKGWLYEGGIRIPQLIKLPNQNHKEVISEPVVSYDLFPTIINVLNLSSSNKDIDGIDLSNLFINKEIEREFIFWHFPHYHGSLWKPGSALRSSDWKLIEFYEDNRLELYNLKDDLSETNDLADIYPEIKSNLYKKLNMIKENLGANETTINKDYQN
jgi:arylsulfatase A-like enzyme